MIHMFVRQTVSELRCIQSTEMQPCTQASFPEGAVSFKLLFTQAPVERVPFLEGAPTWSADANRDADKTAVQTAARVSHVGACGHDGVTSISHPCQ